MINLSQYFFLAENIYLAFLADFFCRADGNKIIGVVALHSIAWNGVIFFVFPLFILKIVS